MRTFGTQTRWSFLGLDMRILPLNYHTLIGSSLFGGLKLASDLWHFFIRWIWVKGFI